MSAPEFKPILERMDAVHQKKNHDYATSDNPYSNFDRAAVLASWFDDPADRVFASIIGIKLARLAELHTGKTPLNESLDDNHLDLDNYCVLWHGYTLRRNQPLVFPYFECGKFSCHCPAKQNEVCPLTSDECVQRQRDTFAKSR